MPMSMLRQARSRFKNKGEREKVKAEPRMHADKPRIRIE
jgi:hypothetical protein